MVLTLLTSTTQLFDRTLLSLVLSGVFSNSVTGMRLCQTTYSLASKREKRKLLVFWKPAEQHWSFYWSRQDRFKGRGKRVHLWMWGADWPTGMEVTDGGHFEDNLRQLGFQKYFKNLPNKTTLNPGNLSLSYWTFLIMWNFFKIGLLATVLSTSQGVVAMDDCGKISLTKVEKLPGESTVS